MMGVVSESVVMKNRFGAVLFAAPALWFTETVSMSVCARTHAQEYQESEYRVGYFSHTHARTQYNQENSYRDG